MYTLLDEFATTYVSIGHRPSLIQFHNKKIRLAGPGHQVAIEALETGTQGTVAVQQDVDVRRLSVERGEAVVESGVMADGHEETPDASTKQRRGWRRMFDRLKMI